MQISMEILSQTMPGTDSGAKARQKTTPYTQVETAFSKIFDEKRAVKTNPQQTENGKPGKTAKEKQPADEATQVPDKTDKPDIADKSGKPDKQHKPDKADKIDKPDKNEEALGANLAIGTAGNQNMVVFILEGDKESATIPEIGIDAITAPGTKPPETVVPETSNEAAQPVTADAEPAEPIATNAQEIAPQVSGAGTEAAPSQAENTEKTVKVETPAAKTGNITKGALGEVTARTPEIRTSEQQETGANDNDSPGNSGNGDLSHLENENDAAPVKGQQKEKTYSQTADAVRSRVEGAKEPVHNIAAPLAEGIKPERFQADQQMRQATANAPVRKENLFDEMVSRIDMMQDESKSEMTIQLKPEFLGKVALEVAMDDTGLHVRINAEDSSVRSMINTQMNTLLESLGNKGISVAEVEVTYTGVNNGAFKDSQEGQAQQERSKHRHFRGIESLDSAEFYTTLPLGAPIYYLDEEVSSVEYRA